MKELQPDEKFLQSYVYSEFGAFFVSTIYRQSSSTYGGMFYETLAWKIDPKTNIREQKIIADNSGSSHQEGALHQHERVVADLLLKGEFNDPLSLG